MESYWRAMLRTQAMNLSLTPEPDEVALGAEIDESNESMVIWVGESGSDREPWILNDGTRVNFIDE